MDRWKEAKKLKKEVETWAGCTASVGEASLVGRVKEKQKLMKKPRRSRRKRGSGNESVCREKKIEVDEGRGRGCRRENKVEVDEEKL